jgi:hypothetical protein
MVLRIAALQTTALCPSTFIFKLLGEAEHGLNAVSETFEEHGNPRETSVRYRDDARSSQRESIA